MQPFIMATSFASSAAAAVALLRPSSSQSAPYLGGLEPALVKDLLRKVGASSTFQAPASLLAAIARVDARTNEPAGLLKVRTSGQGRPGQARQGMPGHVLACLATCSDMYIYT